MTVRHSEAIEVRRVQGKGRGVFARRRIRQSEEIERVPVLVVPAEEVEDATARDGLAAYCFAWGRGTLALALGYGSLYNHSYRPNARYDDLADRTKVFTALRDIEPGEEITVNYNGDPSDGSPIGFEVIESAGPPGSGPDRPETCNPSNGRATPLDRRPASSGPHRK